MENLKLNIQPVYSNILTHNLCIGTEKVQFGIRQNGVLMKIIMVVCPCQYINHGFNDP